VLYVFADTPRYASDNLISYYPFIVSEIFKALAITSLLTGSILLSNTFETRITPPYSAYTNLHLLAIYTFSLYMLGGISPPLRRIPRAWC
jgi:hypothetical protein